MKGARDTHNIPQHIGSNFDPPPMTKNSPGIVGNMNSSPDNKQIDVTGEGDRQK